MNLTWSARWKHCGSRRRGRVKLGEHRGKGRAEAGDAARTCARLKFFYLRNDFATRSTDRLAEKAARYAFCDLQDIREEE